MTEDRLVTASQYRDPRSGLADLIGQDRARKHLHVAVTAARRRREPLDHVLFAGPSGVGKTTFAVAVAHDLGAPLLQTTSRAIERPGDMAGILSSLAANQVLLIDDIERLAPDLMDVLVPVLQDFEIDIVVGQGPGLAA